MISIVIYVDNCNDVCSKYFFKTYLYINVHLCNNNVLFFKVFNLKKNIATNCFNPNAYMSTPEVMLQNDTINCDIGKDVLNKHHSIKLSTDITQKTMPHLLPYFITLHIHKQRCVIGKLNVCFSSFKCIDFQTFPISTETMDYCTQV